MSQEKRDAEIAARAIEDAIEFLANTPAVTISGKGGAVELLRERAKSLRESAAIGSTVREASRGESSWRVKPDHADPGMVDEVVMRDACVHLEDMGDAYMLITENAEQHVHLVIPHPEGKLAWVVEQFVPGEEETAGDHAPSSTSAGSITLSPCARCGVNAAIGLPDDLSVCESCSYRIGAETARDELAQAIRDRDASDRAFSALKAQTARTDAELVALKAELHRWKNSRSPIELTQEILRQRHRADSAEAAMERVRALAMKWPNSVSPGEIIDALDSPEARVNAEAADARIELPSEAEVEAAARELAGLAAGEPWPTNAELGGGPTGTRDDEYRSAMRDEAKGILVVAAHVRASDSFGETATVAATPKASKVQESPGIELLAERSSTPDRKS